MSRCLPTDWGDGWDNVFFNVTCENQSRADERIPLLFQLPFKHKGIMTAPLIGAIDIEQYLQSGIIEQVLCGGENYDGSRPCHYDWVRQLSEQCRKYDVTFDFIETGSVFIKDGKTYHLPDKQLQAQQAFRSGLSHLGKPMQFHLVMIGDMKFQKKTYISHITIRHMSGMRQPHDLQWLLRLRKM